MSDIRFREIPKDQVSSVSSTTSDIRHREIPVETSNPSNTSQTGYQPQMSMQTVEELKDPKLSQGIVNPVKAAVKGAFRGVGDSILDIGDLAADILHSTNLKSTINKGKERNQASAVEIANPTASGIGAGIGYGTGSTIIPGVIVKEGVQVAKALPVVGKGLEAVSAALHPAIRGATTEGSIGAIQGATMSPDSRTTGALVGGGVGGVAGALGGALSKGLTGTYKNIGPEIARMKELGFDPKSPEFMGRVRQELANRGTGSTKTNIQEGINTKIQGVVDDLKPDSVYVPNQSPNQIIKDKIATNFKDVEATKSANYKPLTDSTGVIEAKSVNDATQVLTKKGKDFLPTELPENTTFAQLQDYRQALDGNLKSAKSSMRAGSLSNKDLNKLYEVRANVTKKMQESADSQGLGEQFNTAEQYYKTNYLPFRTFSKSGKVNSPKEIDATWNKVNTLMNSKNPNPKELRDLVSTLGDEGKQTVGWSLVQNALTAAKRGDEIALPKFNNEINKYKVSGLGDIIADPQYKQAVIGINRIVADGKEALKIKSNKLTLPIISQVTDNLMQTEAGIKLIIKLGSMNKSSKEYRAAIQTLFTGASNLMVIQPGQRYNQPARGRNPGE